ncbi:MAG: hypothetical protein LBS32_00590 [Clostridiales Family XIII bacterium]|jgi:hypothetical protein|nr:hypothetical protein [Clostridiales Family XIII bacterium]
MDGFMGTTALTEGDAPFRIGARVSGAGDGVQLYIGGGDAPHIGSVAVSLPRPSLDGSEDMSCTTSVYNILGHKDDRIAVMFAEAFCREFGCVAVAAAGVHVDGAGPGDIDRFLALSERLLERALAEWRGRR